MPRESEPRPMFPRPNPPPGGNAGAAQQTAAAQAAMIQAGRGPVMHYQSRRAAPRRARAAPRRARAAPKRKSSKRKSRLVKGSAAAKAWGRKMKRLRRR